MAAIGRQLGEEVGEARPKTMASALFERLRADIVAGVLPPAMKLRLSDLSDRYDCGVIPLREALSRLAATRLVTAEDQKGFRVAPVSMEDLRDLTWVRQQIDVMAIRGAIALGGRAWESRIVALHHRLANLSPIAAGERGQLSAEWQAVHREFHLALVEGCRSPWLLHFHMTLFDQAARYRRLSVRYGEGQRDFAAEHAAILAAVLARESERAAALVAAHVAATSAAILAATDGQTISVEDAVVSARLSVVTNEAGPAANLTAATTEFCNTEEGEMVVSERMRGDAVEAPGHAELVARAEALVPLLRERAAEAERTRRVPAENITALREAGLLRVLQPRRYGGYEASLRTHLSVVAELARGCASTAWCVGVFHAHSWLMGSFPEQALAESYGADPNAIISAVIAPRGMARVVDGGFMLSGAWPFCSGSQHAQWLLLGAGLVNADGKSVDEGDLLVPASEVTIKDDWNVQGLRGTGSCTVIAEEVFVPQHRYLSLPGVIAGRAPGAPSHETSLYRCAAVPVLSLAITPAALGAAEAAFAAFKTRLPGREVAYTDHEVQLEMPVTHSQAAQAATRIDTARLVLEHCVAAIEDAAHRGEEMELKKRARVRMDCAYAVRLCFEAVETLFLGSGGSGIAENSPIGRAARDLHAINMHGLLNLETNQEMYGRIVLGLKPNTPLI